MKAFKPFKSASHFIIQLPNGCRWIQKIDVTFTAPVADDKIEMISEMNKANSVKFKLTNRLKTYAKFKAYFAVSSSNEFSVSPANG